MKYYKTTIKVTVLSEDEPINFSGLDEVHNMITTGDCSGLIDIENVEELSAVEARKELISQGSDPEFFGLE